jgi:AcrR family transcriptional regulator
VTRRRILDAALQLIEERGGSVALSDVARQAGVSRQAIYLHFADRAALYVAVVRRADELRGLPAAIQRIQDAASGVEAIGELVAMQARMNPGIWRVARALDEVRRQDEAAERAWQDRLENRLVGCRAIVSRLAREGALRPDLREAEAADVLWTLTSLGMWEDLVLGRKWGPRRYRRHITALALEVLMATRGSASS